jgi:hypothetical protein
MNLCNKKCKMKTIEIIKRAQPRNLIISPRTPKILGPFPYRPQYQNVHSCFLAFSTSSLLQQPWPDVCLCFEFIVSMLIRSQWSLKICLMFPLSTTGQDLHLTPWKSIYICVCVIFIYQSIITQQWN